VAPLRLPSGPRETYNLFVISGRGCDIQNMPKAISVSEVLRLLEIKAPSGTALPYDNVGLLAGDPAWETRGAVLCIDLSEQAIELARRKGYRLIINHHPCIFPRSRGMSRVTSGDGVGGLVFEALRQGIAVIACHTNFDTCALEVPHAVAEGLGFEMKGRLHESSREQLLKLVTFVPETHLDAVRLAVFDAGAGQIGNYDCCGFTAAGEGSFRGGVETRPFIGKPGELERAREIRFETILPRGLERSVLRALREAHPYEEIAYDLYPVEQTPGGKGLARGLGFGVWGEFSKPRSFPELVKSVRGVFKVEGFMMSEPAPKRVRRVAFAAGKGADFADSARAAGCDLFITGEAGYHVVLESARKGLAIMELGHRESEIFFTPTVKGWLSEIGLPAAELSRATQKVWTAT